MPESVWTPSEKSEPKKPKTFWLNARPLEKLEALLQLAPNKEKLIDEIRIAIEEKIETLWATRPK